MASLFIALYRFFQARKFWLFTLVLLSTLLAGITVFQQLQLNENIEKVIPLDAGIQKVNRAYQNTKFSDELIVLLQAQDSSQQIEPDALIDFGDSLVASFTQIDSQYIRSIRYTLSNNAINELYDLFYQQLPLFLTTKDYEALEERLDSVGIQKALRGVYKNLISPAGFVLKDKLLADPLGLAGLALKQLENLQIEGNYSLYKQRVMSADQQHLLLFISPSNGAAATGENAKLLAALDQQIALVEAQFEQEFAARYFGGVAVSVANAEQIKTDINYTVVAALLLLLPFIALFFRQIWVPILLFLPVAFGALMGLLTLVLLKDNISAISLGVGAILLGIALDFSLHVLIHFRAEQDIKKTLKAIATPTIMSSLTTSSAFLCLLYMSSEALRDLGIFAAVAVFSAALAALILLPHLLKKTTKPSTKTTKSWLDRFSETAPHQNKWLKGLALAATILFACFYTSVEFEDDTNSINFMPEQLAQTDQQLQALSGEAIRSSYVVTTAPSLEAALEANKAATTILDELQTKGQLQRYASAQHFLPPKSTQIEHIEAWNEFWTRAKKDSLQQQLIREGANTFKFKPKTFQAFYDLLERKFEPVPLNTFAQLQNTALSEYISDKGDQYSIISILKLDPQHKAAVYAAFQDLPNTTIFDKQFIADRFAANLKTDFSKLVNWSFVVVFLILLVAFGRLELALLTILPVLLSWVWTLGIMGLLGLKLNLVNVIICTFIFGLGIDYSIFITKGLLHDYKYGTQSLAAYKTSILLSALTTLCGMGVMIFAQHPALFSIASLSIIGLSSILLLTFIVQPFLFSIFITNRKHKKLPPYTLLNIVSTTIAYTYFLLGCLVLTTLSYLLSITPFRKQTKKHLLHRLIRASSATLIHLMFNVRKVYIDRDKLYLDKPAMIIANHQSFLDIMMILMLHPKIVLMTNNWVWRSPIFGRFIQFADFYPSDAGAENSIEHLRPLVQQGYSIMVFPEGTRSKTGLLNRFKKGAFFIAEQLGLDIQPIIFHGTGDCIRKNDFLVHGTTVTMKFLDRISPYEQSWGTTYAARTKSISRHFKQAYTQLQKEQATPAFFEDRLIKNYIYKGPVLEWYTRVKVRLEDRYELFHELIPRNATITDIGCGYGIMSNMLALCSPDRSILGIDYDKEKIKVAQEGFLASEKVQFVAADATTYSLEPSDVFLISDMLHYLPPQEQEALIIKCLQLLPREGCLIIRDGDRDLEDRHKGTEWTERFSTAIFSFNKTQQELSFLSGKKIEALAHSQGFRVKRIDRTQKTSNIVFVLHRRAQNGQAKAVK